MSNETSKTASGPSGGRSVLRFIRNVLLFLASPFIALSYLIAMPVVGFYQFTKSFLGSGKDQKPGN